MSKASESERKEKMRAMVLSNHAPVETDPLQLSLVDRPSIRKNNELTLEIEACGVCRSNLHLIEGDWKKYGLPPSLPIIPGHEIVGNVKEIGEGVKKIKVGDRVGIQPLYSSCMHCDYCSVRRENLCNSAQITGETVPGGYAEYISVEEEFATPIPDSIDSEHAAPLFCPGITAYKAVSASEPALGRSVGIFGIGGVGHLAIQFAKMQGSRVIAVSRSKKHLDLATKLGADNRIFFQQTAEDQDEFLAKLKKEQGGKLLDSAIVFAPSDEAIDTAIKSVKKGGVIVVGVFGKIPTFYFNEEKIIKGSVIGSRNDMIELVQVAKDFDLKVVVETFSLGQANSALLKLKKSEIEARAVLVPKQS